MKVSVIIPTYNNASYITESVRSVLDQTYRDVEVLVVDDGSTDGTREVVGAIGDKRVRYVPMDRQSGNYFARNKGIDEARGGFLAFLDADDLWTPDKLAKQMDAFGRYPEAAVGFTDHLLFEGEDKKALSKDLINTYPDEGKDHERFMRRLILGNFIITSSVLAKRECFEKVGPFDTTFQNAMDYDMWVRLVFNYKVCYVPEALVLKRNHMGNISRNKINSMKAVTHTLEKYLSQRTSHRYQLPDGQMLARRLLASTGYYLGLEYLQAGDFDNAKKTLEICRAPGKGFFRLLALTVARMRSKPLLALVRSYRRFRVVSKIKPL